MNKCIKSVNHPCCGLSNLTGSLIIGSLQTFLCSILCATYAMGLGFLSLGRELMLEKLNSEAGLDFVSSLGLDSPKESAIFIIIILYVIIYSFKTLLAIQLLISISLDSLIGVKVFLILETTTFTARFVLFLTSSIILMNLTPEIILMYIFSLILELYCIWIVRLLILDMKKPTWNAKTIYPEGFRIHSKKMCAKELVFQSRNLITSIPISIGADD